MTGCRKIRSVGEAMGALEAARAWQLAAGRHAAALVALADPERVTQSRAVWEWLVAHDLVVAADARWMGALFAGAHTANGERAWESTGERMRTEDATRNIHKGRDTGRWRLRDGVTLADFPMPDLATKPPRFAPEAPGVALPGTIDKRALRDEVRRLNGMGRMRGEAPSVHVDAFLAWLDRVTA